MEFELDSLVKVHVGAYIHAAAFTLFFYDYALTVVDEFELVWNKPQRLLGRILFFINRYLPFLDVPMSLYTHVAPSLSNAQCKHQDTLVGGLFFGGILVSELIMILRVWVLWGQTRFITITLLLMVILTTIFCVTQVWRSEYELVSLAVIGLKGCFPKQGSPLSPTIPILGLVNETILFVLTMMACLRQRSDPCSSVYPATTSSRRNPMATVRSYLVAVFYPSNIIDMFARDGAMYYVLIVAVAVPGVYFTTSPEWKGILPTMSLQRTLNSVLVSRIFIYLRQHRLTPQNAMPS